MKLGILVNTERHLDMLLSISRAALGKGHEVSVFVMDKATRLLVDVALQELAGLDGIEIKYCDYNAMLYDVPRDAIAHTITSGSQYDNAIMTRDVDRVISL